MSKRQGEIYLPDDYDQRVFEFAVEAARIFQAMGWEWAGYGVPGPEDVLEKLQPRLAGLTKVGSSFEFGRIRGEVHPIDDLVPDEGELKLSLVLQTLYVGADQEDEASR